MTTVYLDYAAATPLDPAVHQAMRLYLAGQFYNPSATYLAAQEIAKDIAAARKQVAHWLGSLPSEIIFTAGGTEANNLAIHGVMRQYPDANIVVSAIEHESVLAPAQQYDVRLAPVLPDGRVDLETLGKLIDDKTVLVSVMYANNEIGTIEPIREVAAVVTKKKTARQKTKSAYPLLLHTDACQAAQFLDLHASRLGVDLMTLNAGKIYGPKQAGVLYVKRGTMLQPQIVGGGQENGYRSGTESAANIIGMARALDLVQGRRHEEAKRLQKFRDDFIKQLKEKISNVVINGSRQHRLPNNVHVTLPGQDNERLIMALDERGIMCAAGSACSASKEDASHVLKAIGKSDQEAYSSLRFTFGRHTTAEELAYTVKVLAELL